MKALAAVAILLMTGGPADAQVRDQPARKPAIGTGAVAGRVVHAVTREPIPDAVVALLGGETAVIRVGQTDAKGTFILPGLPAGKFLLGASKTPYLGALHGSSRPGRPGTAVVLTEGQIVTGLEIQMWPGAVVTGTVTDELGEPVPDVEVQLQRAGKTGSDQLTQALAVMGSVPRDTTDDRGVYRIYGAHAGDYHVVASVPQTVARARRLAASEVADGVRAVRDKPAATIRAPEPPPSVAQAPGTTSYAPVYFPGTAELSRAARVTVATGEERSGVNISLEIVPLARVEGIVFAADGTPGANVQVMLQRLDETQIVTLFRSGNQAQTSITGQFTVRNVAPGQYRVLARIGGTGQPALGPGFWASVDVTVGGQDVTGLTLQLQPAMSVAGRVVIDKAATAAPLDLTSVMAVVAPLRNTRDQVGLLAGMVGGAGLSVLQDGSFEVGGLVAGPHVILANAMGGGPGTMMTWRVGSVVVDGRDLTDLPFDLKPGAVPKDVVVTLTDVQQRLSGVISDASGRPLTASTVLMFAADRRYWYPQSRRVLASRPGTDGSYEFSGILAPPAGEYFLSVVTDLEPDQQYDLAFLDALAKAGPIRLAIGRGESKRQDLKVR